MELRPRTRSTQTDLQPLIFKKKAVKPLPKTQEYRQDESIVLLSKKTMKRFRVFLDEEWGFPSSYNSYIHETNYDDEDYDSSDQIIECGLKKCLRLLEKTVTQKTKQTGDSQETDTEFESIDQCKKSTLMSLYYPESELSKTSK